MEEYKLKNKTDIKMHNVVFATTSSALGWKMERLLLLEDMPDTKIDEYVLVEGEHCSCYGFDDTDWWCIKLTEEELDELLENADKSEGLRKELKEFWSRYCGK